MEKIPVWARVLLAVVGIAAVVALSRLLLWADKLGGA